MKGTIAGDRTVLDASRPAVLTVHRRRDDVVGVLEARVAPSRPDVRSRVERRAARRRLYGARRGRRPARIRLIQPAPTTRRGVATLLRVDELEGVSRSSPAAARASARRPRVGSRPRARPSPSSTATPRRGELPSRPRSTVTPTRSTCATATRCADAIDRRRADRSARLDILVNNAGTRRPPAAAHRRRQALASPDRREPHRHVQRMRAAIPLMLESGGGAIVNNASVSGITPTRNEAAYSAAKAGVIALDQERRARVRADGARQLRRARLRAHAADRDVRADTRRVRRRSPSAIPLGRMGEADEIAEVILFLASRPRRATSPARRSWSTAA